MKNFKFYMTSNVGGGGGTVSRLLKYLPEFNNLGSRNIGLLLNYNYLTFYEKEGLRKTKRTVFDREYLKLLNFEKIDFYDFFNLYNTDQKLSSKNINQFEVLLDTGSGKILADSILYYDLDIKQSRDLIFDLVEHNLLFATEKKSTYVIAMDFCYKNTYKNDEGRSKQYKKIIFKLSKDMKLQNDLLLKSLSFLSNINNNKKPKLLAPIHGDDELNFINHYESIIELENKSGLKFHGFALGGLNKFRHKYGKQIGKIVKRIRDLGEDRHIHILGSAGINKIIPLLYSGANSFDCHTPWRRANENYEISMPLFSNTSQFCKFQDNVFKNISVNKLNISKFSCDCDICNNYNIKKLKNFIDNKDSNIENFHLSKILIYLHSIYQYDFIIENYKKNRTNPSWYLESINNEQLKKGLIESLDFIL
tara:strand:- start:1905 stop:3167 length:1263 start_codon:yes stop_codon:yes gene_type:complete